MIRDLAKDGLAVLMISDDVPELLGNCNDVWLMHRGRLVERFDPTVTDEDAISDALRRLR